ncbi:hypothetical protein SUGI_0974570 [Cryptomeria japonica]|uniref:nudix hydrolase 16, mitochondrial n=1 Tax=Cryptomeria japonica TaxID=3369 RepID=UPI0024148376|nr:nudix hydrolase 16, mitochondrial [Cryptomeria japonica]XP_057866396.2 nudix hydrolase 16, mitochondrial [Cryptomeria japonica]GLJ46255.1 hypothetical protein SUGI_0974570 [Cryptomeria japonica]
MMALVARTGRHQQRYDEKKYRLVAGCIPFRYKVAAEGKKAVEVLMVSSQSGGERLLFPKGGWENDESVQEAACREALEEAGVRGTIKKHLGSWEFRSKRYQDDCGHEGFCRAQMFALFVTEELESWPEKNNRQRKWVTITEAAELCCYDWMQAALHNCASYTQSELGDCSVSPRPLSQQSDQGQI